MAALPPDFGEPITQLEQLIVGNEYYRYFGPLNQPIPTLVPLTRARLVRIRPSEIQDNYYFLFFNNHVGPYGFDLNEIVNNNNRTVRLAVVIPLDSSEEREALANVFKGHPNHFLFHHISEMAGNPKRPATERSKYMHQVYGEPYRGGKRRVKKTRRQQKKRKQTRRR